jgi:hypothetical protein
MDRHRACRIDWLKFLISSFLTIPADLLAAETLDGRATMQKIYPRTNLAPLEASEKVDAKPFPQIDEALREFARQDAPHRDPESEPQVELRREPENPTQSVADVNLLVQRVAGVSLGQLDDAIVELGQLRDFLHSEGERIQREISGYLQLNQIAIGSTKGIVDQIVHWKEAAHNGKTKSGNWASECYGRTPPGEQVHEPHS